MATLNAINDKMMELVFRQGGRIDALFFCPHTALESCNCRKPRTGMLLAIAERFHVDLKEVPVRGRQPQGPAGGRRGGGQPILVLTGKGRRTREEEPLPRRTLVFDDLSHAARHLIAHP